MLNKITINNFKSIKHLEYSCAGLNLLTGMNGAGKSSFIRFLLFLRAYSRTNIQPARCYQLKELSLDGKWTDYCYCYAQLDDVTSFDVQYRAKENFCWTEGELQMGRICRDIIRDEEEPSSVEIICRELRKLRNSIYKGVGMTSMQRIECNSLWGQLDADEVPTRSAFKSALEEMKYVDAFRAKPCSLHIGTGKFGTKDHATGRERCADPEGNDVVEYLHKFGRVHMLDETNPMLFPGTELRQILKVEDRELSKLDSAEYFGIDPLSFNDDGGLRRYALLIDQINAWLSVVSPGAKVSITRRELGDQEEFEPKVNYGAGDAQKSFKPGNVGFGISYVLPILTTLLTARPTDIIVIENPEAHLHPRGQSELGGLIARAVAYGVQVFVETHSDHLINGIRVAVKKGIIKPEDVNVAFFERGSHDVPQNDGTTRREIYSEVTNIKVDANGSLSEWPKGFMDEWGIQQMKLLRP